ncbi:hypothetical protein TNCV_292451 [Trichonephila clavipes]|nr:hypothetical protein TNCV_292451 [Trichonephila clavipes]
MDIDDVQELLDSYNQELTKDELIEMRKATQFSLPHHDVSGTIRPTDLKLGRRVLFVDKESFRNGFCENRPQRAFLKVLFYFLPSSVTRQPKVGLGLFRTSLLPARVLQFLVLRTRRSFSSPSIHLRFGLPNSWALKTFLEVCTRPF